MARFAIWSGISNICGGGGMWLNWVEQNRETDEEHADDCVEEGFQLARVKSDGDGEGRQGSSRFEES